MEIWFRVIVILFGILLILFGILSLILLVKKIKSRPKQNKIQSHGDKTNADHKPNKG